MAITRLQSPRDFFRIWFFWKNKATLIFLLIVLGVMIYAYTATPLYESSAEILVLPKTNEGEVISSGYEEKDIKPITNKDIITELELLASDSVIRETVAAFGKEGLGLVEKDASFSRLCKKIVLGTLRLIGLISPATSEIDARVSFLKSCLTIEPVTDSNLIAVSLRAEEPKQVHAVLKQLLHTYIQHRNAVYTKEEGLKFYEDQADVYKNKLDKVEGELKAFQKEWNIVNLEAQNTSNISLLAQLNSDLKLLEISYDEASHRIEMLKDYMKNDEEGVYLTKEMRQIPAIVELERGIVPLLIKKSEISKNYTATSREYLSILDQISMLRGEIRAEISKAIKTDELELESMGIKIASLQKKIDLLQQDANALNQKEKAYQEIQRQVKLYKDSYLLYRSKSEDSKIISEKSKRDLANVSIATKPAVAEKPVFPNRLLMLVLSLFFGVFSALCAPFILESIDNKLKTADDVEVLVGLPVISTFSEARSSQ